MKSCKARPRLADQISGDLKRLVDDQAVVIRRWISMGQIAAVDPYHLIFSIWALTQHYADFDAQIRLIRDGADPMDGADGFLETLFDKLLQPWIPGCAPASAPGDPPPDPLGYLEIKDGPLGFR